jgi:hypothetical protein
LCPVFVELIKKNAEFQFIPMVGTAGSGHAGDRSMKNAAVLSLSSAANAANAGDVCEAGGLIARMTSPKN